MRFRDGVTEDQKRQLLQLSSGHKRKLRGKARLEKVSLTDGRDADALVAELRANPAVELVEPNFTIAPDDTTPNDPQFAEQWSLRNTGSVSGSLAGADIAAVQGWDTTTGDSSTIVAVIDSGIDFTHPDLQANQWTNPREQANGQDDDGNGFIDDLHGWDYVTASGEIKDEQGHGTSVAGIIAAEGNNSTGTAGVMWSAGLMSLRVLDGSGTGDVATAIEAIDYAVANGAKVINASWGTDEESLVLKDAIMRAGTRGCVIICSAGNSSRDITDAPYYPSSFNLPNVISVAASDSADHLSTSSNWGTTNVTLAAPGVNLLTTKMDGGYHTVSGTSAATAVVSGIAGLIRTARPRLKADRTKDAIANGVRAVAEFSDKVAAGGVASMAGAITALASLPPDSDQEDTEENDDDDNGGNGNTGGGTNGGGQNSSTTYIKPDGTPASDLPNLDEARRMRAPKPQPPAFIQADFSNCAPNDPECDGTVNAPPTAHSGGPYTGQRGVGVQLNGSYSSDSDGAITSYAWDFGDGTTGLGAQPTHTYGIAGTYSVTLTVTDNNNAKNSARTEVRVAEPPSAGPYYDAAFIRQTIPPAMFTDEEYAFSVTMRNTGNTTWTAAEGYRLFKVSDAPGASSVELPGPVVPGGEVTFYFTMTGIDEPTVYNYQWRMTKDGIGVFGSHTPNIAIMHNNGYGSGSGNFYNGSTLPLTRLEPGNRTGTGGVDLYSGNHNWSLPILDLSGRAGLDLSLGLSYNSLVWTRHGSQVTFNGDFSYPGMPGFRFGLPVVQGYFFNEVANTYSYLLVMPSGERVELRRVGSSSIYESVDSSRLRLDDGGLLTNGSYPATTYGLTVKPGTIRLWTPGGTQISFRSINNYPFLCSEIKDRNGNTITATQYLGRTTSITDTLGRVINFSYDSQYRLTNISQTWQDDSGANITHTWARFYYTPVVIQTNFSSGITKNGPANGATVSALARVWLHDGTLYNFNYTSWGQVHSINRETLDDVGAWKGRWYVSYNLPLYNNTQQSDCPRFTERREWAENWNNRNGVPSEVVTTYGSDPTSGAKMMTMPDGTVYKEHYHVGSWGWMYGRPWRTSTYVNDRLEKWTETNWTQDNTNVHYRLNPRIFETNVYDASGNRRRTTIDYTPVSEFSLPREIKEYDQNGTTVLRRTVSEYDLNPEYTSRRIIGLPKMQYLYGKNPTTSTEELLSKVESLYDQYGTGADGLQQPGVVISHASVVNDPAFGYGSNFKWRGNLTNMRRHDVATSGSYIESKIGYNTTGSAIFTLAPPNNTNTERRTVIEYADNFNYGGSRNSYAYPTKAIDPDGFISTMQYRYDTGAAVKTRDPKGAEFYTKYDTVGRPTQVTNSVNAAKTRWVYLPGKSMVNTFTKINDGTPDSEDAYSSVIYDGAGRVRATASDHPVAGNPTGRYSGQIFLYDQMGRRIWQSNPTEVAMAGNTWTPAGDDAAGMRWSSQGYDWQGRPTVSTNQDGTMKTAEYGGCGCAGGAVVTTTDEVGRRQKIYSDALGRTVKAEDLNWNGGVYRTTTNTYNGRDQVTASTVQAGSGGAVQTTTEYDGHGRAWKVHIPEMDAGKYTTTEYNLDDTAHWVTDARGASATYGYNNRGLMTSIVYTTPHEAIVPRPADVGFDYDAAGNRLSMTDGTGSVTYQHDALSRLRSETRYIADIGGSYILSYDYNLVGELKSIDNGLGSSVSYSFDKGGSVSGVSGSGTGSAPQYASDIKYRAWGGVEQLSYGNNLDLSIDYDSRLREARYQVNAASAPADRRMSAEYIYTPADEIATVNNLLDPNFGRSYSYDHVGRLAAASTSGTPFQQTFNYDAWDNMTQRWSLIYRHTTRVFSSYTNNRNVENTIVTNTSSTSVWAYDAAGNVTRDDTKEYTYDAAGRKRQVVERTRIDLTLTQTRVTLETRDGDGLAVRRLERNWVTNSPETSSSIYYLRSSALGGMAVAELDGQGNTREAYVYLHGEKLAKQVGAGVRWVHSDPVTGSSVETGADGGEVAETRREVDPLGSVVPLADPAPPDFTPDWLPPGGGGFVGHDGGNTYDASSGCVVDGMATPCSQAAFYLSFGAGIGRQLTGADLASPHNAGFATFTTYRTVMRRGRYASGMPTQHYKDGGGVITSIGWGWTTAVAATTVVVPLGGQRSQSAPNTEPAAEQSKNFSDCNSLVDYLAGLAGNTAIKDKSKLGWNLIQEARQNFKGTGSGGFKDELTAHGQNDGVYNHVLGHAGAYLYGGISGSAISYGEHLNDERQSRSPFETDARRREALAEKAGNRAGYKAGEHLNNFFKNNKDSTDRLKNSLRSVLCK